MRNVARPAARQACTPRLMSDSVHGVTEQAAPMNPTTTPNLHPFPICNAGHEGLACDRIGCPEHHPNTRPCACNLGVAMGKCPRVGVIQMAKSAQYGALFIYVCPRHVPVGVNAGYVCTSKAVA